MRGLKSTIALVLVLAGLGAYIYFVDSDRPAAGTSDKQKVFTVEADALEEITITSDNETSALRKVDGAWKLTAPESADADESEVSSLTSSLGSLEVNRVVDENASNLAEYGLANPRIKVAYKAKNGETYQLHLIDIRQVKGPRDDCTLLGRHRPLAPLNERNLVRANGTVGAGHQVSLGQVERRSEEPQRLATGVG